MRNALRSGAAALVLAALIAGLVASIHGAHNAREEIATQAALPRVDGRVDIFHSAEQTRFVRFVVDHVPAHDRVRIVMESRTFGLTETYVRLGLGITVWYGRDLKHPPAGLWMRPVTQWFGSMPVAVVMRKGKHPPPHVTTFMHIVRQTLGQGGRDGKPVR